MNDRVIASGPDDNRDFKSGSALKGDSAVLRAHGAPVQFDPVARLRWRKLMPITVSRCEAYPIRASYPRVTALWMRSSTSQGHSPSSAARSAGTPSSASVRTVSAI